MNWSKIPRRLIAIVILGALVIAALMWGPASCVGKRAQQKGEEVARGQSGASIESGVEATNTIARTGDLARETDDHVRQGSEAIRSAPEAAKGKAAVDASCKLRAYRDTPRCKEQGR